MISVILGSSQMILLNASIFDSCLYFLKRINMFLRIGLQAAKYFIFDSILSVLANIGSDEPLEASIFKKLYCRSW